MGPRKIQWDEDTCIDNNLLVRYIEKDTTPEETKRVREHIDECETCFRIVASMIRNEHDPITEAEKEEVRKLLKLTPEEQVEKILTYQKEAIVEPESNESDGQRKKVFDLPSVYERFAAAATKIFDFRPVYLRYAAATAMLFVATLWGVRYYQVGFQIMRAENLLEDNYRIFIEDVRLSGNYASSGIDKTMGDGDEPPFLNEAASKLEGALKHDQESTNAKRLLAQISIIEGNYDRANSLLTEIQKNDKTPAKVLNDLGVLAYQEGNWGTAADRFQSAIDAEPRLLEARFNLALTKLKQGQEQEAATILERYITLEKDDIWKRAAMRLLQKIR